MPELFPEAGWGIGISVYRNKLEGEVDWSLDIPSLEPKIVIAGTEQANLKILLKPFHDFISIQPSTSMGRPGKRKINNGKAWFHG